MKIQRKNKYGFIIASRDEGVAMTQAAQYGPYSRGIIGKQFREKAPQFVQQVIKILEMDDVELSKADFQVGDLPALEFAGQLRKSARFSVVANQTANEQLLSDKIAQVRSQRSH